MIASVVMEMLIDENFSKYYSFHNESFCIYKRNSILKDLNMLSHIYDKNYLISLLEKMLNDDPSKRITPTAALQFINQNREEISFGGSLKMFQDEENQIKPKLSYRTSFDFESNGIKLIQPNVLQLKLTACPIKPVSKRSHNKSIGMSLTSSKHSIETKDKSLSKSRIFNIQSRGNSLNNKLKILKH